MLSTRIKELHITVPLDPYMSLRGAAGYTGLSIRNLRGWLASPDHALPCYRVNGKILVRRSELDAWLRQFRSVGQQDLDAMVDDLIGDLRGESNNELGGQTSQHSRNTGVTATARKRVAAGLQKDAQP